MLPFQIALENNLYLQLDVRKEAGGKQQSPRCEPPTLWATLASPPNSQDAPGCTPPMLLATGGQATSMKALLSREANVLNALGRKVPRVGHVPSTDT